MATEKQVPAAGTLLAGLLEDVQRMARLEVDLAKREMRDLAVSNGIAGASLAGAVVFGSFGLLVGVPVWAVMLSSNRARAAGIWVGLYLGGAAGLAAFGRSRLQLRPPEKTIASLKENSEWIAQRIKSSAT